MPLAEQYAAPSNLCHFASRFAVNPLTPPFNPTLCMIRAKSAANRNPGSPPGTPSPCSAEQRPPAPQAWRKGQGAQGRVERDINFRCDGSLHLLALSKVSSARMYLINPGCVQWPITLILLDLGHCPIPLLLNGITG